MIDVRLESGDAFEDDLEGVLQVLAGLFDACDALFELEGFRRHGQLGRDGASLPNAGPTTGRQTAAS
jgi:hypothetical protein